MWQKLPSVFTMSTDIIEVQLYSEDRIVFKKPEDISLFRELLIDQGKDIIVVYVENGVERGELIKADFGPKVTDGKVKLTSERKI